MRFEMYTEKTIAQCMRELNERMDARPTATRPAIDGWIEKGGKFSLAVSTPVARRFSRTTRLHAKAERENGITVIRGRVPDGVTKEGQALIFGALLVVGLFIMANGDFILGLFVGFLGAALYVPLMGDRQNSEILMKEIRSVLKAKDRPPKKRSGRK